MLRFFIPPSNLASTSHHFQQCGAADARVTAQAYRKHLHRLRRNCMSPTQSISNDLWLRKHFRLFICSEAFGAFAVTSTALHVYSPCHALAGDCAKPICPPARARETLYEGS